MMASHSLLIHRPKPSHTMTSFEDLSFTLHKYGDHDLQRIGVWLPDPESLKASIFTESWCVKPESKDDLNKVLVPSSSDSLEKAKEPENEMLKDKKLSGDEDEVEMESAKDEPEGEPESEDGEDEGYNEDEYSSENKNASRIDYHMPITDPENSKYYTPVDCEPNKKPRWVIFIHGGAWVDPNITYESFIPTIKHLLQRRTPTLIGGFASIDYRLSADARFPQDTNTPKSSLREARHPDHLQDVCSALIYLTSKFSFESDYVLVGHSAGASLAFQTLTKVLVARSALAEEEKREAAERIQMSLKPQEKIRKRKRSVSLDSSRSAHGIHGDDGSFEDRVHDKQTAIGLVGCDWQEEEEQDKTEDMVDVGQDQGLSEDKSDNKVESQDADDEMQVEESDDTNNDPNQDIPSDDGDDDWEEISSFNSCRNLNDNFPLPAAIVGIAGLYDFEGYNARHGDKNTAFFEAAFGPHKTEWSLAAPSRCPGTLNDYHFPRPVVIGSSIDDEYIDEAETTSIVERLGADGVVYFCDRTLRGSHDFIWQDGAQQARLIMEALRRIMVFPLVFGPKIPRTTEPGQVPLEDKEDVDDYDQYWGDGALTIAEKRKKRAKRRRQRERQQGIYVSPMTTYHQY